MKKVVEDFQTLDTEALRAKYDLGKEVRDWKVSLAKKDVVENFNEEKIVGKISPEDIFDYIYAVLHSPSYREKYKEFLKIDFPHIPYPKNLESFKKLVKLGTELRLLHLLESPKLSQFITTYPYDGSNIVEKPVYKDGNVLS